MSLIFSPPSPGNGEELMGLTGNKVQQQQEKSGMGKLQLDKTNQMAIPNAKITGARSKVGMVGEGRLRLDTGESTVFLDRRTLNELIKCTSGMEAAMLVEESRRSYGEEKECLGSDVHVCDDTTFKNLQELESWLNVHGINTVRWGSGKSKSLSSLFEEIKQKKSVLVVEKLDPLDGSEYVTAGPIVMDTRASSPTRLVDPRLNRLSSSSSSGTLLRSNSSAMVGSPSSPKLLETTSNQFRIYRYLRVTRTSVKREFDRGRVRYLLEGSQELGNTGQVRYRNMLLSSVMLFGENVYNAAKRSTEKELQNICGDPDWRVHRSHVNIPRRDNIRVNIEDTESPSYPGLMTRYILYTVGVTILKTKLPQSNFVTTEYLKTGHVAVKHHWKWKTKQEMEEIMRYSAFTKQSSVGRFIANASENVVGDGFVFLNIAEEEFVNGSIAISVLESRLKQWSFSPKEIKRIRETLENDVEAKHSIAEKESKTNENEKESEKSPLRYISKDQFEQHMAPLIKQMMIATKEELIDASLTDQHLQVLSRLFPESARIYPKLLHGGFSGSYVLQVHAVAPCGTRQDPTVVKLDKRTVMNDELRSFNEIAVYMNDCAPAILKADVQPTDPPLEIGGLKFELVGAVWMLPDFHMTSSMSSSSNLLNTFKTLFLHESVRNRVKDFQARQLGTFATLQEDSEESDDADDDDGSDVDITQFDEDQPFGDDEDEEDTSSRISDDAEVFGHVPQVLKEVFGEILRKTTLLSRTVVEENLVIHYDIEALIHKTVLQDGGDQVRGKLAKMDILDPDGIHRKAFRDFLRAMDDFKISTHTCQYVFGMVHGDLNGMNILIDSQDIVWIIDFAASGKGHVLQDLVKLESCILYEYIKIETNEEFAMMKAIVDTLVSVKDLRANVARPKMNDSPKLQLLWESIHTLRMYAGNYAAEDPEPIQMVIAMLHFAMRALNYRDINDKRLPFYVATKCVGVLHETLRSYQSLKPMNLGDVDGDIQDNFETMNKSLTDEQMEYEKKRYFHDTFVRDSYFLDVITRERIYISEQTVELELMDSSSRDVVLNEELDVDELQAQRTLQKRLAGLQSVFKSGMTNRTMEMQKTSRFTSAIQVLSDSSTANLRAPQHRVILGPAASGKSVLMRKLLLSIIEEQRGAPDDLVPVLILLIDLGRIMTKRKLTAEDDLLDCYLENVFGEGCARLAFFREVRARGLLSLLFDGLDEAGDHRLEIEKYIAKLSKKEKFITISSRVTGFNESVFRDFHFYQVMPLTTEMQSQIIETRLGRNHPMITSIKKQLKRHQYAEIARNPLMLSLLVSLLSKKLDSDSTASGNSASVGHYTRAFLYKHAVAQLLHKSSMNKFGMRRGIDDKEVETRTRVLASGSCYNFLKRLSFFTHSSRLRDIGPETLTDLTEVHVDDETYFPRGGVSGDQTQQAGPAAGGSMSSRDRDLQNLYEVISILQSAVFDGRCGLFAVSKVATQFGNRNGGSTVNYVMRFVHLSFQEYLAGLYIVDHLTTASKNKTLEMEMFKLFGFDKNTNATGTLHESWWQGVLIGMAGSMSGSLFYEFVKFLLSYEDVTGANVFLCAEMLPELPENAFQDPKQKEEISHLISQGFKSYVKEHDLVCGLTHQSRYLQHLVLTEVIRFYDPLRAAFAVAFGPGVDKDNVAGHTINFMQSYPWRNRVAAVRVLGLIPQTRKEPTLVRVILNLWSDDHPEVQQAAVEAIKTLGAETNRLVVDEVIRQLRDDVEVSNAHEIISALQLRHTLIIEELLSNASQDSEFYHHDSFETMKLLEYCEEVVDILCRAVGHSENGDIRQMATEYIVYGSPRFKLDGHSFFKPPENVENALVKWIQHTDPEMATKACESLKQYYICSPRIIRELFPIIGDLDSPNAQEGEEFVLLRKAALETLSMSPIARQEPQFLDAVKCGLKHKHPLIRCQCVMLVETMTHQTAENHDSLRAIQDVLVQMIRCDDEISVRLAALNTGYEKLLLLDRGMLIALVQDHDTPCELKEKVLRFLLHRSEHDDNHSILVRTFQSVLNDDFGPSSEAMYRSALYGLARLTPEGFTQAISLRFQQEPSEALMVLFELGGKNLVEHFPKEAISSLLNGLFEASNKQDSLLFELMENITKFPFKFEDSDSWLHWFASTENVFRKRCLIELLGVGEKFVETIESNLIQIVESPSTDRAVRLGAAQYLYTRQRLQKSTMFEKLMESWILGGDILDSTDAFEFLFRNSIDGPIVAKLLGKFVVENQISVLCDSLDEGRGIQRQGTHEHMDFAMLHLQRHRQSVDFHQMAGNLKAAGKHALKAIKSLVQRMRFEDADLLSYLNDYGESDKGMLLACYILAKNTTGRCFSHKVRSTLLDILCKEEDMELKTASKKGLEASFKRTMQYDQNTEMLLVSNSDDALACSTILDLIMDAKCFHDGISVIRLKVIDENEDSNVRIACLRLLLGWRIASKGDEELQTRIDTIVCTLLDQFLGKGKSGEHDHVFFDVFLEELKDANRFALSESLLLKLWTIVNTPSMIEYAERISRALLKRHLIIPSLLEVCTRDSFLRAMDGKAGKLLWINLIRFDLGMEFRTRRVGANVSSRKELNARVAEVLVSVTEPWLLEKNLCERHHSSFKRKSLVGLHGQVLELYQEWGLAISQTSLEILVRNSIESKEQTWIGKVLDYILAFEHYTLSKDMVVQIAEYGVERKTDTNCPSFDFFVDYPIKSYEEAEVFVELLRDDRVAPFVLDPLLTFFRNQRALHRTHMKTGKEAGTGNGAWEMPAGMKNKLDAIVQDENCNVEASYIQKEMRIEFEVREKFSTYVLHRISLKGQAYIKEQRSQSFEMKMMYEEEWSAQRAIWFPSSEIDRKLGYMSRPESLRYQQSRLDRYSVNFFISAMRKEMSKEIELITEQVMPEVNRRLKAMGIAVEARAFIPRDDGVENWTDSAIEARLDKADSCKPFSICLVGEQFGKVIKTDPDSGKAYSICSLERDRLFLNRPSIPGHPLVYFLAPKEQGSSSSSSSSSLSKTSSTKSSSSKFKWDHPEDLKLHSQFHREKMSIKAHPYTKTCTFSWLDATQRVTAATEGESGDGPGLGEDDMDERKFVKLLVEDILLKIANEFPINKHFQSVNYLDVCDKVWIHAKFPLLQECRLHECMLAEYSMLTRASMGEKVAEKLPVIFRETFTILLDMLKRDSKRDQEARYERRLMAQTNKNRLSSSSDWGNMIILLTGNRGSGKSTFMATLADYLRKWNRGTSVPFVVFYGCGVSHFSTRISNMLLKLGGELLQILPQTYFRDAAVSLELEDIASEGDLNLERLTKWWHNLLEQVSNACMAMHNRVILVMDGLFEHLKDYQHFQEIFDVLVPEKYEGRCPPGISIVLSISTSTGDYGEILQLDQVEQSKLHIMSHRERMVLVEGKFREHLLELPIDDLNIIVSKESSHHPTYLNLLCDAVVTKRPQDLNNFLRLFPQTTETSFDWFIDDLETHYGVSFVRATLLCLALGEVFGDIQHLRFVVSSMTGSISAQWSHFLFKLESAGIVDVFSVRATPKLETAERRQSKIRSASIKLSHFGSRRANKFSLALAAAKHSTYSIKVKNDMITSLILKRYKSASTSKVHESLCELMLHQVRIHHSLGKNGLPETIVHEVGLREHFGWVTSTLAHHASKTTNGSYIEKIFLDPKNLILLVHAHKMSTHDIDGLMDNFESAKTLCQVIPQIDDNVYQTLSFYKQRIDNNLEEILADPGVLMELF